MPQDSASQAVPQDLSLHLRSSLLRDTTYRLTRLQTGTWETHRHGHMLRNAQTNTWPHMQTHTNVRVRHTVRHKRTGRQKAGYTHGHRSPQGKLGPADLRAKRLTSYSCPWLGSPRSQQPIPVPPASREPLWKDEQRGAGGGGRGTVLLWSLGWVHTWNLGAETPRSPSPPRPEPAVHHGDSEQPPAEAQASAKTRPTARMVACSAAQVLSSQEGAIMSPAPTALRTHPRVKARVA